MGGYMGKLLRVDLTRRSITEEAIPDSTFRQYLGGVGLGARIIYDEVPLNVECFDPENRLVFMTGPLTGTVVAGATDWTVTSIRPDLDSRTIHGSHSHGYWGAYLKMNGYDGIIVQGAASKPTLLWIHNGKAELRDASQFWGMDTHDTEDAVKAELGGKLGNISVATIGPAGENLIKSAIIENDKHSQASKGMGSIMGSKKLKAIAVTQGPYGVPISKPKEFLQTALTWRNDIAVTRAVGLGGAVRPAMKDMSPEMARDWPPSLSAVKNWSDPEFGVEFRAGRVEGRKFVTNRMSCWACPRGCGFRVQVTEGPHTGYVAVVAPGGEGSEGAAGMAGIKEPGTVFYLLNLIDRLGMDGAPIGAAMGLAFECYEEGILTKEKTGGLELRWGNAEVVEKLWRMAVRREGLGAILAEGPRKTAEYIGEEALDKAVHFKGAAPNMHDWRAIPGMLLGQAVTPAGPCWGSGSYPEAPAPDLGYEEGMDPWDFDGKGTRVAKLQRLTTFVDSNGTCWFATGRALAGSLGWAVDAIAAATGWENFTSQECMEVGERVMNLQKMYAMRRGLTKADDLDVGPRVLEPHKVGPAKGLTLGPHLLQGVEEFYEDMGWDRDTGQPLPATLRRLGLGDLVKDLPKMA